jgi:hypothetical protein
LAPEDVLLTGGLGGCTTPLAAGVPGVGASAGAPVGGALTGALDEGAPAGADAPPPALLPPLPPPDEPPPPLDVWAMAAPDPIPASNTAAKNIRIAPLLVGKGTVASTYGS